MGVKAGGAPSRGPPLGVVMEFCEMVLGLLQYETPITF